MTKTDEWLTVDRAGLGALLEERGKAFVRPREASHA